MRVSFVTPTFNRPEWMAHLLRTFRAQTVSDKQLVVIDDSPVQSDVMHVASQLDPRVVYEWSPERRTIGAKRNEAVARSSGDVIVHMDDDDAYSPEYAERMIARLSDADVCKLACTRAYRRTDGTYWRVEHRQCGGRCWAITGDGTTHGPDDAACNPEMHERGLYGFGFSYVYRASVARAVPFADMSLGEDWEWMQRVRAAGYRVALIDDGETWATHMQHAKSTAPLFPTSFLGYGAPPGAPPEKSIAATIAWGVAGALAGAGLTAVGEQVARGRITGLPVAVGATVCALAAGTAYRVA